jgi:hypothetical protein
MVPWRRLKSGPKAAFFVSHERDSGSELVRIEAIFRGKSIKTTIKQGAEPVATPFLGKAAFNVSPCARMPKMLDDNSSPWRTLFSEFCDAHEHLHVILETGNR